MRSFIHNNKMYQHILELEDDSVQLIDHDRNTHLIYTANCAVISPITQAIIGHTSTDDNDNWKFTSTDGEVLTSEYNIYRHVEGLIDFEADISKWYLDKIRENTNE